MFSSEPFQVQAITFPFFFFLSQMSPQHLEQVLKVFVNEVLLPFVIAVTCTDTGTVALLVAPHITTE